MMAFFKRSAGKAEKSGTPKKNAEAKQPRKFTLELSPGGLIAAGFGALLCLVWVFILGVLLGRGYRPENDVPELTRIIPEPPRAEVVAARDKAEAESQVLKAEELDYMKSLHQKPPKPERAPEPAPKPASKPAPNAQKATPQPSAETRPATEPPLPFPPCKRERSTTSTRSRPFRTSPLPTPLHAGSRTAA